MLSICTCQVTMSLFRLKRKPRRVTCWLNLVHCRHLGQVCLFLEPYVIFLSIVLSLILEKLILYKPAKQVFCDACLGDLSINYSMSTQREESLRERGKESGHLAVLANGGGGGNAKDCKLKSFYPC